METIKEEKKADLEQLLNSLIEKGWKPRGEEVNKVIKTGIDEFGDGYVLFDGELNGYKQRGCNMTELVSKSSGLWQFVCENGMVALKLSARIKNPRIDWEDVDDYNNGHIVMNYKQKCEGDKSEYRLIEASLKDESELEDFLLTNIKIEGNS